MKRLLMLALLFCFGTSVYSQVFPIEAIQYNGSIKKHVNLVIMGDGFTSTEQDTFIKRAKLLTDYYFNQSPWGQYRDYYNVFAIKVESNESGAKHPHTASDCPDLSVQPKENPDNYFGSTFDGGGIHRLIVVGNSAKVASVLASNIPGYDQVVVLVNTPYYGGSGGPYSVITSNTYSAEIMCHEAGHSFADLADEYWAGDAYAGEKINMTAESNASKVKWKGWIPLGKGIGVYQHTGHPWYKPYTNCKMELLGVGYCAVCQEAIIEKIHSLTGPLLAFSPDNGSTITSADQYLNFKLDTLITPQPNTLKTIWALNGATIQRNAESLSLDQTLLSKGAYTLSVDILDTTNMVIAASHFTDHITRVEWKFDNSDVAGIAIAASQNKISYSVFPNPVMDVLNVNISSDNSAAMSLSMYSSDAKLINAYTSANKTNSLQHSINMQGLAPGIYTLQVHIGEAMYSRQVVKAE